MDRLADYGNAATRFPARLRDANDDFSFAGLKTSVRYFLQRNPALLDEAQNARPLRQRPGRHCRNAGDKDRARAQRVE
jgi:tRNA A37 threonylcarbamoyltransferase TsaD